LPKMIFGKRLGLGQPVTFPFEGMNRRGSGQQ